MGVTVFILGASGTGKSYSMKRFPKDKMALINVQGKVLPFRGSGQIQQLRTDKSDAIMTAMKTMAGNGIKSIIIDDYQYVMANEYMSRCYENGYNKFTEIGRHAWDILNTIRDLPQDVIVYILCHIDRDDNGKEKIKTIGKLLDEKICLEGMATIVLKTAVADGKYTFLTQNSGNDTVKSPEGMFPSYAIENDLYYVDQKIRAYFEFPEAVSAEQEKAMDEEAKTDIPAPGPRRRRGAEATDTSAEATTTATTERRVRVTRPSAVAAADEAKTKADAEAKKQADAEVEKWTNVDDAREELPFGSDEKEELPFGPATVASATPAPKPTPVRPIMPEPVETAQAPETPKRKSRTKKEN